MNHNQDFTPNFAPKYELRYDNFAGDFTAATLNTVQNENCLQRYSNNSPF